MSSMFRVIASRTSQRRRPSSPSRRNAAPAPSSNSKRSVAGSPWTAALPERRSRRSGSPGPGPPGARPADAPSCCGDRARSRGARRGVGTSSGRTRDAPRRATRRRRHGRPRGPRRAARGRSGGTEAAGGGLERGGRVREPSIARQHMMLDQRRVQPAVHGIAIRLLRGCRTHEGARQHEESQGGTGPEPPWMLDDHPHLTRSERRPGRPAMPRAPRTSSEPPAASRPSASPPCQRIASSRLPRTAVVEKSRVAADDGRVADAPERRGSPFLARGPAFRSAVGQSRPHVVEQEVRVRPDELPAQLGPLGIHAGQVLRRVAGRASRLVEDPLPAQHVRRVDAPAQRDGEVPRVEDRRGRTSSAPPRRRAEGPPVGRPGRGSGLACSPRPSRAEAPWTAPCPR